MTPCTVKKAELKEKLEKEKYMLSGFIEYKTETQTPIN
jgi:hypothetical protein